MSRGALSAVARHLRHLAGPPASIRPDAELLRRFVSDRDEAAFAFLVERHGPLVWSVCRRTLRRPEDAEDAFQATFLVLARKAASIRKAGSIGSWLHGVAYRTAMRMKQSAAKQRQQEQRSPTRAPEQPVTEAALHELQALLDAEVQRLPEKYRAPFVLCCLEGRSRAEAARELGWKEGTVAGRVAQARERLRDQLARRGVVLAAALCAMEVARETASAIPPLVAGAAREAARGVSSPRASALAQGVIRAMLVTLLKGGAALLLALTLLAAGTMVVAAGAGALGHRVVDGWQPEAGQEARPVPPPGGTDRQQTGGAELPRADIHGDPLPPGALARLGTIRLRPGGNVKYLAFAPDGKRLASWVEDYRAASRLSVWDAATGRELRQIEWPDVRASAFAWLADGRGVAVLELGDDSFYVWDFTDEKAEPPPLIRRPRFGVMAAGEDREGYSCFAVAPNGKLLAAGSGGFQDRERPVHVWELATGRAVRDLKPPRLLGRQPGNCDTVAFTSDSRSLLVFSRASRAREQQLVVWDVAAGEQRRRMAVPLAVQQGNVKVFAIGPDGRSVVLGMPDGTARAWDLTTGRERAPLATIARGRGGQDASVSALGFSADGRRLVAGSRDNAVHLWDLAGGKEVQALRGHRSWVEALAVSPDGKRLASAGQDGLIRLWDMNTGADACPLDGHRSSVSGVAVAPDGRTAATVGDGTLRLWDIATGRPVRRADLGTTIWGQVVYTPGGRVLALVSGNRLRLRDAATGEALRPPEALADRPCQVFGISADGKVLVTAHEGMVAVWEWPVGRLARTFELPTDRTKKGKTVCNRLVLSADGRLLVTVSMRVWQSQVGGYTQDNAADGALDLWDVASGGRVRRLGLSGAGGAPALSPDGSALLVADTDWLLFGERPAPGALGKALRLLDLATGRMLRTFPAPGPVQSGDRRTVQACAFAPDGHTMASAEEDGSVLVFETATGLLRRRLVGHRSGVTALAFTPDGRRLVTASGDHTGLVWDVSLAALGPSAAGEAGDQWADLASTEPERANRVLARLAADPGAAVALLKGRLKRAAGADAATLDHLVGDLDSDRFGVRQKAYADLDRLGETVADGLRERLARAPSAEVRRRIEQLLEEHDPARVSPERVREMRALEVLEQAGTPEARAVLERLAEGAPAARLTREAKASLGRLERRSASSP